MIVPAEYKTVTERHLVQEASERIEIVPAEYKWVEERVMTKEASTATGGSARGVQVEGDERLSETGHTGWVMEKDALCR